MAEVVASRVESSTLSAEGRVVIPVSIRKALGLEPGDTLSFRVEGECVLMTTRASAIAELQLLLAGRRLADGVRASDDLIAERRAEEMRENLGAS